MVEFTFDATQHAPWKGADYETSREYAHRVWNAAEAELDLATACALAPFDREVFDGLLTWAKTANGVPDEWKVRLFDALVRKPPRKGKAETAKRDAKLKAIARGLQTRFGKKVTTEVLDILAELPGTPSRDSIRPIIYKKSGPDIP